MPRTTTTKNNQGFQRRGGAVAPAAAPARGDRLLLSVGMADETTTRSNGNKRIRRDDDDDDDDATMVANHNVERNIEVEEPHPSAVPSAIVPSAVESRFLAPSAENEANNENIDTIKKIVTKNLSSIDWTVVTTGLDAIGKLCDSRIHGIVKATSNARLFHELGGQGIILHFITKHNQQRQSLMEWTLYALHHSVKLHFGLVMSSCLIDAVLQTMERHPNNQLIQLYGILFLNTLLEYAPPDSEQQKNEMAYMILVKYRGLPVVEEATRRFPTWKNVQTAAVQLVWDLTNILPESRDTIEDAGGLVILASGITCLKGGIDELWCNRAKEMMNYFTS